MALTSSIRRDWLLLGVKPADLAREEAKLANIRQPLCRLQRRWQAVSLAIILWDALGVV